MVKLVFIDVTIILNQIVADLLTLNNKLAVAVQATNFMFDPVNLLFGSTSL